MALRAVSKKAWEAVSLSEQAFGQRADEMHRGRGTEASRGIGGEIRTATIIFNLENGNGRAINICHEELEPGKRWSDTLAQRLGALALLPSLPFLPSLTREPANLPSLDLASKAASCHPPGTHTLPDPLWSGAWSLGPEFQVCRGGL